MRILLSMLFSLTLLGNAAAQSGACSHLALVSGYESGVHVYDACNGEFLRMLDPEPGRLAGPQAIRIGPDGLLYVVSELTARVHRYNADDLSFHSTPVNVGPMFGITGIAFSGDTLYACGYASSDVRRYSLDGQLLGTAVAPVNGVRGLDNGMTFGPDGLLYIPAFDTHNVLRHNPATGQNSVIVPAGENGPVNARGILFRPDGQTFLVSAEGRGQILEYRRDNGSFVRILASSLIRPSGMVWGPDGSLIVVTRNGVRRLDPDSGEQRDVLIAPALSGGLRVPTYIALIPNALQQGEQPGIDDSQIGTQYWISGVGKLIGRTLVVDEFYSTSGPRFGADFDPQAKRDKRWGAVEIEFSQCAQARMDWSSTGEDSAGFGAGGYALERLVNGPGTQRCQAAGFAQSPAEDWLQGVWWGGPSRDGEGFIMEYVSDDLIIVSWFTHRPSGF